MSEKPVCFMGKGPVSKSLFLRALTVKSYFPSFQIKGDSACDDALHMKTALEQLASSQRRKESPTMDCGLSGAVLRFLALRLAREPDLRAGSPRDVLRSTSKREPCSFILKGQPRLFERPLQELISLLGQLSCETKRGRDHLHINSEGWRLVGDALTVSGARSSQFASAVLLNSWLLPSDLHLSLEGPLVSSSYFQMSLSFLSSLGMKIEPARQSGTREYYIPARQKPHKLFFEPEQDMSCLFALSAMTVGGGEVVWTEWPEQSWQPDFVFPGLLQKMGFKVIQKNHTLKITGALKLHPIEYNIKDNPDLFPVLSALCALSKGESHLYGAPHLLNKESNRLERMARLISKTGRLVTVLEDGLIIRGPLSDKKIRAFDFDPAGDHRMAMAGAVLKKAGIPIRILNPEVVNKSFPDFWHLSHNLSGQ